MPELHGGNLDAAARRLGCRPGQLLDASASLVPFAPPRLLRRALRQAALKPYPDRSYQDLRTVIATRHGLDPAWVLPGNGAAELFTWAARDAAAAGPSLLPQPGFADYRRALRCWDGAVEPWPLLLDWRAAASENLVPPAPAGLSAARAVWITNPHNPTGQLWSRASLEPLFQHFALVICDEAFLPLVPGGEAQSLVPLLADHPNLVVIRSLTKLFAIAGLRLGYGGGFMDKTLAEMDPRPAAVGIGYAHGFLPLLKPSLQSALILRTVLAFEGWDAAGKGGVIRRITGALEAGDYRVIPVAAALHGRLHILDREAAVESTGHGSPLPPLKHGGPGRAGGGEELGGIRAVKHLMQRTALQGSPTMIAAVTGEYMRGAKLIETEVHPFRRYFEDLQIGESLLTHRRTVGEADIVAFGGLSGDYFYMHFDEIAAKDSPFGKRIAHGYFVLSAAAGLFVSPAPGPVLANYGLDTLRFVKPVGIGDTIQARLTAKRKIDRQKKDANGVGQGVVAWDVEVTNQLGELVASYDILTLVAKRT